MALKANEVTAPAHWAHYLINGDASGMDQSEVDACYRWRKWIGMGDPVAVSEETDVRRTFDGGHIAYPGTDRVMQEIATYTFLQDDGKGESEPVESVDDLLTYGQLPTFKAFKAAFKAACPTGLYEISLPRTGQDFANMQAAGLLVRETGYLRRYTACEMAHERNTYFYTVPQLYRLLERLVDAYEGNIAADMEDNDTEFQAYTQWAGGFASSILSTLGFEWI